MNFSHIEGGQCDCDACRQERAMKGLPPDFSEIAQIEDLSIAVTKLEMERDGIAYTNIAGISLDDRLALGMRVAVNEAKLMKAKKALRDAQLAYSTSQRSGEAK